MVGKRVLATKMGRLDKMSKRSFTLKCLVFARYLQYADSPSLSRS